VSADTEHEADPRGGGKARVGISSCLLGEEVRYDGDHERNHYAADVLSAYFEWVPVCPEVEVGMGTPREPIRLVDSDDGVRLVGIDSERDWTDRMDEFSTRRVEELASQPIHGFILKKNSPSCGVERVGLFDDNGTESRDGVGAFARVLLDRMPNLPVAEEDRLDDASFRKSFIARVYAYRRTRST